MDGRVHQWDATPIQREQATAMVDRLVKWSDMERDCIEITLSLEALEIPLLLVGIQLVTSKNPSLSARKVHSHVTAGSVLST